MSWRSGTWLFVLVVLGCADVPPATPELIEVVPSTTGSIALTRLRIEGRAFVRRQVVDFNHRDAGGAVGTFTAKVVGAGGDVVLAGVTQVSDRVLEADLPVGVAPGVYALTVTDPWDRPVTLADALQVLEDCERSSGPFVGDACDGPDSDRCPDDRYACAGTTIFCSSGSDDLELCDGLDNDCDPATADGAAEPTLGQPCDGADTDQCYDDTIVCGSASLACSAGTDTRDLCNGLDDDCNAATADGSGEVNFGQSCDGPDGDSCTDDSWGCAGGVMSCSSGATNVEACNGVDDDCSSSTADGSAEANFGLPCDGPADLDGCTDGTWGCAGGPGLTCLDGPTTVGCVAVDVGQFDQGTTTVPHTLGFVPSALFVWATGSAGIAPQSFFNLSFGMVDEGRSARASAASRGAASLQAWRGMADAAVFMVDGSGGVISEATVSAWDATSFTLNWSGGAGSRKFQFLAIGGAGVRSKLLRWQMPTVASVQTISGAGFTPTSAFVVHSGGGYVATPPTTNGNALFGFGALAGSSDQFNSMFQSLDGLNPTNTSRSQALGDCLRDITGAGAVDTRAVCGPAADGHSVNFVAPAGAAAHASSLVMAGVRVAVRCFAKSSTPAPTTTAITGLGFRPSGVLFLSDNAAGSATPARTAKLSIGASDGAQSVVSAFSDEDNTASPRAYAFSSASYAYHQLSTTSGATTHRFRVQSLDADGFTVAYDLNDTASDDEICAVAFGGP